MPPGAGAAGGSGAKPKPTSTPDEDDPSRRGPYHPPEEQTKQLLEIHHSLTKLLQTMGVDPCKEYENSKLENILEKISSADLACRVCGKVYSSSSRMKNHFRKRHLGKTKHQCKICKKYYTDPGSLRVMKHPMTHQRILSHVESALKPFLQRLSCICMAQFMINHCTSVPSLHKDVTRSTNG